MVMTAKEVAAAAEDETSTASDDETEIASADCLIMGEEEEEEEETSSSSADATDDDSSNDSEVNGKDESNATSASSEEGNDDAAASTEATAGRDPGEPILVIEGEDFAPGQVVVLFSMNSLVAIDDIDEDGNIEAKVPANNVDNHLRFVQSSTGGRTGTFNFDGQTLTASEGETAAESTEGEVPDNILSDDS
jgi:hypothetical protein